MAKSPNQKLKLLYLMQLLTEKTDEAHPVTMDEIIAYLASNGVSAERKSLYDDIEALRRYGYDVEMTKSRPCGYYVGKREFELAELKLLVDSVLSSQFITERKTMQLIKKLEKFASVHDAQSLHRQVQAPSQRCRSVDCPRVEIPCTAPVFKSASIIPCRKRKQGTPPRGHPVKMRIMSEI